MSYQRFNKGGRVAKSPFLALKCAKICLIQVGPRKNCTFEQKTTCF